MELLLLVPLVFGQTRPRSSSTSELSGGATAAILIAYFVIIVGSYVFTSLCYARILKKAGLDGWWGWVPFLNFFGIIKAVGREPWWIVLYLIPCTSFIAVIIIYLDLAKSFGKSTGYALGLIFLSPIFLAMLAFGDSQYLGPSYSAAGPGYPPGGYGQGGYGQGGYGQPGYPQPGYGQPQPQQPPYPQQGHPQPQYPQPQYPQPGPAPYPQPGQAPYPQPGYQQPGQPPPSPPPEYPQPGAGQPTQPYPPSPDQPPYPEQGQPPIP
jgi:hypothetical protein